MTVQYLLESLSNTTLRVIRDDLRRHRARITVPAEQASCDPLIEAVEVELSLSDACSEHGTEVQL